MGLTEDRYVASVEYRERSVSEGTPSRDTVGGLFVIHHAIPFIFNPRGLSSREAVTVVVSR